MLDLSKWCRRVCWVGLIQSVFHWTPTVYCKDVGVGCGLPNPGECWVGLILLVLHWTPSVSDSGNRKVVGIGSGLLDPGERWFGLILSVLHWTPRVSDSGY